MRVRRPGRSPALRPFRVDLKRRWAREGGGGNAGDRALSTTRKPTVAAAPFRRHGRVGHEQIVRRNGHGAQIRPDKVDKANATPNQSPKRARDGTSNETRVVRKRLSWDDCSRRPCPNDHGSNGSVSVRLPAVISHGFVRAAEPKSFPRIVRLKKSFRSIVRTSVVVRKSGTNTRFTYKI